MPAGRCGNVDPPPARLRDFDVLHESFTFMKNDLELNGFPEASAPRTLLPSRRSGCIITHRFEQGQTILWAH